MNKLIKTIKITNSPFSPSLEVVGNFVVKLHVPYSDSMVTIKINPNITHYEEKTEMADPAIDVKQVAVSEDTKDTQTLLFDFKGNNIKKIDIGNKSFEVKLLNIGKKNIQGQDFPEFEFLVTEV